MRDAGPYPAAMVPSPARPFRRLFPFRRRRVLALGGLLWALLAVCLAPGGARGDEEGERPLEYVGSALCSSCHQDQHARWSGSSHAQTFEVVSEENLPPAVLAQQTVFHPPGKTRFSKEGERWMAETVGPDGKRQAYHLSHVVGRMRVRMFVATMSDGRLQVLPSMLEAPTGEWFDYTHLIFGAGGTDWDTPPVVKPGDPSFWTGPVRSWDARCARCHVTGWAPQRPDAQGRGPRATQFALGVQCEACHGPGSRHVEFREAKQAGDDPILHFAELAHDQALGMCLQCHMESEVVQSGFTPGEDIFEYRDPTLLVDAERIDTSGRPLELIYDGVPFSASRCVQEGKLTCVTCHHPHGTSQLSQLREAPENDQMCTKCHVQIGQEIAEHSKHDPAGSGARCVNCHMPFLTIERGHGVVADHSISTPRYDLKSDRAAQVACTWCHQGGLMAPAGVPRLEEAALKQAHAEWYGDDAAAAPWMQALGAARLGEADANVQLLRVLEDRELPRVVRGSAAELLGRYAKRSPLALLGYARDADSLVRRRAVTGLAGLQGDVVDAALLRALEDPSRAVRVAAARAALQGWSRVQKNEALLRAALPVLEDDARDGPQDDMRWFRLGAAKSIAGDDAGALEAYRRVAELDPFAAYVRKEIERLEARSK